MSCKGGIRRHLAWAVVVTAAAACPAQSGGASAAAAEKVTGEVGLQAGVGLGFARGEAVSADGVQPAFCGGILYARPLTPHFSIQPQIMFVVKGAEYTFDQDTPGPFGVMASGGYTHYYIEVPLLLKVTTDADGPVNAWFGAGIAFAFDPGHEIDAVAQPALGLSVRAGKGAVLVDARYDMGLTELDGAYAEGSAIKTNAILLMVGYAFQFRSRFN